MPANHLDQPTDGLRSLGTELDWAVSYKLVAGEVPWRTLGGGTVTSVQTVRVDW